MKRERQKMAPIFFQGGVPLAGRSRSGVGEGVGVAFLMWESELKPPKNAESAALHRTTKIGQVSIPLGLVLRMNRNSRCPQIFHSIPA